MPTIPSATRIDRQQFSGQQAIVKMPVSDGGLESFGTSVKGAAREFKGVEMINRQGSLDDADLAMETERERIRAGVRDGGIAPGDAERLIQESTDKIGGGLDERDRNGWNKNQNPRSAATRAMATKHGRDIERDDERAALNQQTEDLRRTSLDSEDPGALVAMYKRRLESMRAGNNISAVEEQDMLSKFKRQITMDRLTGMPPEEVTKALDDPDIASMLDSEQIVKLREKAADESSYNSAVSVVDTAMGVEGATRESVFAAVDKIQDPRIRRHAGDIARAQLAARDSVKTERATDSYSKLDQMARDKVPLQRIKDSQEWMNMSPSQKSSVERIATETLTGTKRTVNNPGVHAEIARLAEEKKWRQVDNLLNGYGDQLTDSTRDKYRTAAADGKAPGDVKYGTMVDAAIGMGTETLDNRNNVKVKLADWYDQFSEAMGRDPTRAEVQAEIDVYTTEIVNSWYRPNVDPTYGATDAASMQQHATLRQAEMREDNKPAYLRAVEIVGEGADQFTMAREFDNQKILAGYESQTSPEGKALWADVNAKVTEKLGGKPVPSSVFIEAYEAERNARIFQ